MRPSLHTINETVARSKSIDIRRTLTALLPADELGELARATGFVRRRRKLDPVAMFWTLTFGFGTGTERSFASLRRLYGRICGAPLAAASFHERFDASLVRFLRAVLRLLIERLAASSVDRAGKALLARFEDVVAADASVIQLHRRLAKRFPGTRTNSSPAAAKLHLAMSVAGHGATRVKLTGERVRDHKALIIGPWVRGRLLLFDLGYFRYQMFDCIDRNGGAFVSRLPRCANPKIVAVHRRHRGRAIDLVGGKLDEVADRLQREELDVEIEVEFKRRVYAGRRRTARRRFRLVGLRDPSDGSYWFYVTNLGVEAMTVEEIGQVYACRWQADICQPWCLRITHSAMNGSRGECGSPAPDALRSSYRWCCCRRRRRGADSRSVRSRSSSAFVALTSHLGREPASSRRT